MKCIFGKAFWVKETKSISLFTFLFGVKLDIYVNLRNTLYISYDYFEDFPLSLLFSILNVCLYKVLFQKIIVRVVLFYNLLDHYPLLMYKNLFVPNHIDEAKLAIFHEY